MAYNVWINQQFVLSKLQTNDEKPIIYINFA